MVPHNYREGGGPSQFGFICAPVTRLLSVNASFDAYSTLSVFPFFPFIYLDMFILRDRSPAPVIGLYKEINVDLQLADRSLITAVKV